MEKHDKECAELHPDCCCLTCTNDNDTCCIAHKRHRCGGTSCKDYCNELYGVYVLEAKRNENGQIVRFEIVNGKEAMLDLAHRIVNEYEKEEN